MINLATQRSAKTTQLVNRSRRDFQELSETLLSEHQIRNKKDVLSLICSSFSIQDRNDDNVESLQLIPIDVDNDIDMFGYIVTLDDVCRRIEDEGLEFAAYTSFSHSEKNPKFRVFIPASRTMHPVEYKAAIHYIKEIVFRGAPMFDPCTYKLSQPYYLIIQSWQKHATVTVAGHLTSMYYFRTLSQSLRKNQSEQRMASSISAAYRSQTLHQVL